MYLLQQTLKLSCPLVETLAIFQVIFPSYPMTNSNEDGLSHIVKQEWAELLLPILVQDPQLHSRELLDPIHCSYVLCNQAESRLVFDAQKKAHWGYKSESSEQHLLRSRSRRPLQGQYMQKKGEYSKANLSRSRTQPRCLDGEMVINFGFWRASLGFSFNGGIWGA